MHQLQGQKQTFNIQAGRKLLLLLLLTPYPSGDRASYNLLSLTVCYYMDYLRRSLLPARALSASEPKNIRGQTPYVSWGEQVRPMRITVQRDSGGGHTPDERGQTLPPPLRRNRRARVSEALYAESRLSALQSKTLQGKLLDRN